eukprot:TRINITY_DN30115_c0_g1_i2.p1 TRINITY_DN30115_c0_g1~~TRINITY_DN30115_c0_g1_i2.p1  ORF type:complete len:179 (-),score=16.29 TRINITY_DN30115_c0_g1_i2:120-656(-)
MAPSLAKSLHGSHELRPSPLGSYTFCCHLALLLAPPGHVVLCSSPVRGSLAERVFGWKENNRVSQRDVQEHSKRFNVFGFGGAMRGGPVQSAYMPVAATLFGHVCTVDLIDLVPCLCCTSAAQLAMTSILGWVVLQCLRSRGALLAQSDLSSLLHHINDLVCGGWSIGTRPAESAVSL